MYKILVIDDSKFSIKLVRDAMTSLGYEVIKAYNGHEGIIKATTELPDLIFMDIQMPEMDGISSMLRIKEVPALVNVPVIAYTAYAMKGDREQFLGDGFDGYLSKPISLESLIETVQKHLN